MAKRYYPGYYGPRKRAKTARTAGRVVQRPLGREIKEFMGTQSTEIPPNVYRFVDLATPINIGGDGFRRNGNRIRIKSIDVWGCYGDPQPYPMHASLLNCKAASALPVGGGPSPEVNGPFFSEENIDQWMWSSSDLDTKTFRFRKTFAGLGWEVRYDRDTNAAIGDHRPFVFINNPNVGESDTTGFIINWRIRYYDF